MYVIESREVRRIPVGVLWAFPSFLVTRLFTTIPESENRRILNLRTTDLGFRASRNVQCFRVYRAILGGYLFVLITAGSGCSLIFPNQRPGES